jgi:isovaleryl-CoA dehydrogenase
MPDYLDALDRVIKSTVSPSARDVDASGCFPKSGIEALGEAGILGLVSKSEVGGGGGGLEDAVVVVRKLAESCGSTAMVVMMHYAGTAVIEAHGPEHVRRQIAADKHLTTLAFSEAGSRSHFWATLSTAVADGDNVRLDAKKSWVTSAADADSYVWSSRPVTAEGPQTLWLVPSHTAGLSRPATFDGLGLRGNGSVPVTAKNVVVPGSAMLGADGSGLDIGLTVALPWFLVMSAAFCVGLMEAVTEETGRHLTTTRLEHLDQTLIEQPIARADFAKMRILTDTAGLLVSDAATAATTGREDAMLRLFEAKAMGAESALTVTDLAMKVCGGAAFRKELGIERPFRDARAARVMAPTTDALLDFIGRATGGLPLLEN